MADAAVVPAYLKAIVAGPPRLNGSAVVEITTRAKDGIETGAIWVHQARVQGTDHVAAKWTVLRSRGMSPTPW